MSVDNQWVQRRFDAGKVFTPTTPVDEKSLFAGRLDQITRIIDVINQKGQHAILFGERGVGKTSLVNVLAEFLDMPSVLAPRVNCDSTDTYASTWKKAFEQIQLTQSTMKPGFVTVTSEEMQTARQLLGDDVTPDAVRRALTVLSSNGSTPIFIFDEFDRLPQVPRHAFSDTIKALSDHAVGATVVLVGVADSVAQLIAEHQSVERALVQVQMPRMSADEIRQIITLGASKLGMSAAPRALKQIAKLAQGLPHYAHLLGLHAVRAAVEVESLEITPDEVKQAIEKAISNATHSIRQSYEVATRSARKNNLFEDVLLACALARTSDLGHFAAQDVREPIKEVTGKAYEIATFAQHLTEFCDKKRGPVLQKTGTPRLYRYRFINPLMQPFIIMNGIQSDRISSRVLDEQTVGGG